MRQHHLKGIIVTTVALLLVALKLGKPLAAELRRVNNAPFLEYLQAAPHASHAQNKLYEQHHSAYLVVAELGAYHGRGIISLLGTFHLGENDAFSSKNKRARVAA